MAMLTTTVPGLGRSDLYLAPTMPLCFGEHDDGGRFGCRLPPPAHDVSPAQPGAPVHRYRPRARTGLCGHSRARTGLLGRPGARTGGLVLPPMLAWVSSVAGAFASTPSHSTGQIKVRPDEKIRDRTGPRSSVDSAEDPAATRPLRIGHNFRRPYLRLALRPTGGISGRPDSTCKSQVTAPAPHVPARSPAPHVPARSPAPHVPARSPAPHVPARSPARTRGGLPGGVGGRPDRASRGQDPTETTARRAHAPLIR